MNIDFDAATHSYLLNGSPVPSVTQVLNSLYSFHMVDPEVIERKRQIGQALDDAIVLDLQDDLDEASIAAELQGPFEAWRRFRVEKKFVAEKTQFRVGSLRYRYCGTPDAYGYMGDKAGVFDWKATYSMSAAVGLQIAAYHNAGVEMGLWKATTQRYGVRFAEDGRYFVEPFTDKADWPTFLCFLSVWSWKQRNGILKEKA